MKKLIVLLGFVALMLSCCKEDDPQLCIICEIEYRDFQYTGSGVYIVWEYWKTEVFCDEFPDYYNTDFLRVKDCQPHYQ